MSSQQPDDEYEEYNYDDKIHAASGARKGMLQEVLYLAYLYRQDKSSENS